MSYSIGDGIVSLALAAGIVGYLHITHRTRQKRLELIHQERLIAMDKGIPLPEFPLENPISRQPEVPVLPVLGIVLSTLSAGTMVFLYVVLPPASRAAWVAPLPFTFLGAGLTAFHFLNPEARR